MTRRAAMGTAAGAAMAAQRGQRPNLVLILTDNQGAWTLGCYGNRDIRTPNIDRLASEGMRFTRAFACNGVCSPTRASLLTGLMPSQHGVHCYFAAGGVQAGPGAYNTIGEFRTLPRILTEAGYVAGLSGKWHLGGNLRPQEGFTDWITKPHGNSAGFYDQEVVEDGVIRNEPGYLTDLWTEHGVRFIEKNRDRPFFLYLAYNGPYGLGGAVKEPVRNRHAAFYAGKELPSMPRDKAHPWLFQNREFVNSVEARRKYAAEISGVDDGVGRILETLRRNGLEQNTLVVFLADQGLACGHSGFWGMGDHTRPLTAFDWGMSIPLLVRHPGRIAAGSLTDRMVSTYDVMPSLVDHLGLGGMAPEPVSPGRSFAPQLAGCPMEWDNRVFYEFENVRAMRTERYKYIERIHEEPNEMYDLSNDPGERVNLYNRTKVRTVQSDLAAQLRTFFARHAVAKWDLWNGGRSKSGLITAPLFGIEQKVRL